MSAPPPAAELLLLWHHHQPDYRSPLSGEALLPWVRLHASKDYLDMARRLERFQGVRATFNFVPSLLDQLDAAEAGAPDALFELLARPIGTLSAAERDELARRCVSVPAWARERWSELAALTAQVGALRRAGRPPGSLADDELAALETWFLLGWIDPLFHGEPEAVAALAAVPKPGEHERDRLLELHARLLASVVPAYRALAAAGQIELSASAYYHPILPLLIDPASARRARPDLRLPREAQPMPADAEEQLRAALARHAAAFGRAPAGMWPPEGSVSPEVAALAVRAGVRWLASDEGVLWRSLPEAGRRVLLYQPWRFVTAGGEVALFFRDRELSDRIGFVYHHWHPEEAAADFVARVRRIGEEHAGETPPLVAVILDGENCWENYADDGGPFLDALYARLEAEPAVRTVTPSEVLAARGTLDALPALHSGSWIDADFHIWIGHPEKNLAWDLIARTRRMLVEAGITPENGAPIWEHLYAAEGSDWFWWLGEDHYTGDKELFDRLFREHLEMVWQLAGRPLPRWLEQPIVHAAAARDRVSAPIGLLRPAIDGRQTEFYEWHEAGRVRLGAGGGSMHQGTGALEALYFGFDLTTLYLRVDFAAPPRSEQAIAIELLGAHAAQLRLASLAPGELEVVRLDAAGRPSAVPGARAALGAILELGIPFAVLGLAAGDEVEMTVHLLELGAAVESATGDEALMFTVPDDTFERSMWSA